MGQFNPDSLGIAILMILSIPFGVKPILHIITDLPFEKSERRRKLITAKLSKVSVAYWLTLASFIFLPSLSDINTSYEHIFHYFQEFSIVLFTITLTDVRNLNI